ncbi:hypothetical protein BAPKO_4525 (plasmid) [Borreliella afzelii PKo]|nr:hypothetical protein BAPKO_4525 [Borreliella afzelii PKo]
MTFLTRIIINRIIILVIFLIFDFGGL